MNHTSKLVLFRTLIVLVFTSPLFWNCAREVTPTGGLRDSLAPEVIKMKPLNYSTNFKNKRVTITFDEFVSLKSVTENLVLSPPVEEKPEIKQSGKKIIVDFSSCELLDSTTYSLTFGNSIVDLNEGNILKGFTYIFATGNTIDSLRLKGRIKDAYSHQFIEGLTVGVYSDLSDSAPTKELPHYISKTNELGEFEFINLKETPYRLFAVKDANNNMINDQPSEAIAFYDSVFIPSAKNTTVTDTISLTDTIIEHTDSLGHTHIDTLFIDSIFKRSETIFSPNAVELRLFEPKTNVQYIKSYERKRKEKVSFIFNQPLFDDSLSVGLRDSIFKDKALQHSISPEKDTLTIWLQDSAILHTDTLAFTLGYFRYDSTNTKFFHTDTIAPRYTILKDKFKGLQTLKFAFTVSNNGRIMPNESIGFESSLPIQETGAGGMHLYSTIDTIGLQNRAGKFYTIDTALTEVIVELHRPEYPSYEPDSAYNDQRVVQYKYAPNRFMLRFALPIDPSSIAVRLLQMPDNQDWISSEFDASTNRLYCWITNPEALLYAAPQISVSYPLRDGTITEQTIALKKGKTGKKRKSPKQAKFSMYVADDQQKGLYLDEMAEVVFSNPIQSFDTALIELTVVGDTIQIEQPTFTLDKLTNRHLELNFPWVKGKSYILNLKKNAVTDIYGNQNKDFLVSIKTQMPKSHKLLTSEDCETKRDSLYPEKFWANAEWDTEKSYRFVISKGTFEDLYNIQNDSTGVDFSITKADNLGKLELRMMNVRTPIILQLTDTDHSTIVAQRFSADTGSVSFDFDLIKPAYYSFRLIEDVNANQKWDTGEYFNHRQPEMVRYSQDPVEIKSSRDHIFDWDLDVAEKEKNIEDLHPLKKK